ncbi:MAG: MFS transporter [Chloroherpetonaceae bacterium]|nr:MFS transporter [Chthonomonadaceae bacterium]MDW8208829.1 MFS transporter [Chloroherpetonaceae bacterium]
MPQTQETRPPATPPDAPTSLPQVEETDLLEQDRAQNALAPHQVRWNFRVLVLDVSFFAIGMAFLDPNAVLPLLMDRLGASGLLIGAFAALRFLAFSLVQVFVAYATHDLPRQKPPLAWAATITRLPLLVLPFFLWHAADSPIAQRTALWATIVLISLWALGDGLGYVPWMEIVARGFSARTRGRFFATTQSISGLCSILIAGLLVRGILEHPALPYPKNYAVLTGLSALMFQISLIGVLLIREPPPPRRLRVASGASTSIPPRPPLSTYFQRIPGLIRTNPEFLRLSAIQLLLGFGAAAAPFYVLYAKQRFHLNDNWGGIYQVMLAVSVVVLSPLWTWLSERRSPATAVRCLALVCLLTPIAALTTGSLSPWAFCLTFLLMGGSLGWGMWIVVNIYLLAHISEDERPMFLALINLLFAPSALYPVLGGLFVMDNRFVSVWGLPVLFLVTMVVVATGFVMTLRLPAPGAPAREGRSG